MRKTVYITDSDADGRKALEKILSRKSYAIECFCSAEDCIAALSRQSCVLLITELTLPGLDGIQLVKEVKTLKPFVPSIIVTDSGSISKAVEAIKSGAKHFLEKPVGKDEFIGIVEKIIKENTFQSPQDMKPVSPAEKKVLELVLQGKSSKEIASHLNRSIRTIEDHRKSIMRKLDVDNVVDLIKISMKVGIDNI